MTEQQQAQDIDVRHIATLVVPREWVCILCDTRLRCMKENVLQDHCEECNAEWEANQREAAILDLVDSLCMIQGYGVTQMLHKLFENLESYEVLYEGFEHAKLRIESHL